MGSLANRVSFYFSAEDDTARGYRSMKGRADEFIRGLERSGKDIDRIVSSLGVAFDNIDDQLRHKGSILSPQGIAAVNKSMNDLRKGVEEMFTVARQRESDAATALDSLVNRSKRAKEEMSGVKAAANDLQKQGTKLQDVAAAAGVSLGLGAVLADTLKISGTMAQLTQHMSKSGVGAKDLRATFDDIQRTAKGSIGDGLAMMTELESVGIRDTKIMKQLSIDVERLGQTGDVERMPAIQMLGQLGTQLDLTGDQLHRFLMAEQQLRKSRFGTGSVGDMTAFVGGLSPQLQHLDAVARATPGVYGLNSPQARADATTRRMAMTGGLSRLLTAAGVSTDPIQSLLSMPAEETEGKTPRAISSLMNFGQIGYKELYKDVVTGNYAPIMSAIQRMAVNLKDSQTAWTPQGTLRESGVADWFGTANPKAAMAAFTNRLGGPDDIAGTAAKMQADVETALRTTRDTIKEAQEEYWRSSEGMFVKFRGNMSTALNNVSKMFDIDNPPMKKIYQALNRVGEFLADWSGKFSGSTRAMKYAGYGTAGVVGLGGLGLGLGMLRAGTNFIGKGLKWGSTPFRKLWSMLRGPAAEAAPSATGAATEGAAGATSGVMGEAEWLASQGFNRGGITGEGFTMYGSAEAAAAARGAGAVAPEAASTGARALGATARMLGKIAPWLTGAIEAYSTYKQTGDVAKAGGAGIGAGFGSVAGAAIGQAVIPIPIVGALIGAAIGAYGGGALGRTGVGMAEDWMNGKKSAADTLTSSWVGAFVRELGLQNVWKQIGDAVATALRGGKDVPTPEPTTGSGATVQHLERDERKREHDERRRDHAERRAAREAAKTSRGSSALPTAEPKVTAPPDSMTPPTPIPGSVQDLTQPQAGPLPKQTSGNVHTLADDFPTFAERERQRRLLPQGAADDVPSTNAMPVPAPTPTMAMPAATPPGPLAVPDSNAPRVEAVPQPRPTPQIETVPSTVSYRTSRDDAKSMPAIDHTPVVQAINNMSNELQGKFDEIRRTDLTRRSRGQLSHAFGAAEI